MSLDPKTWTVKTQEAIAAAIASAKSKSNPELTVDHLLMAVVATEGTVVTPVLAKLGQSPGMVRDRAQEAVDRLPRAQGGDEPRMNRELSAVMESAEKHRKDLRDDYLSVEHLLPRNAFSTRSRDRGAALGTARGPRQPSGHRSESRGQVRCAREVRPGPDGARRRGRPSIR
jgi:ATP-dependent Clp protease ATP-binding subunit ClpB